jgi:hypothetical protein
LLTLLSTQPFRTTMPDTPRCRLAQIILRLPGNFGTGGHGSSMPIFI